MEHILNKFRFNVAGPTCLDLVYILSRLALLTSGHSALDSAVMISLIKESTYLISSLTASPLCDFLNLPSLPSTLLPYLSLSLLHFASLFLTLKGLDSAPLAIM